MTSIYGLNRGRVPCVKFQLRTKLVLLRILTKQSTVPDPSECRADTKIDVKERTADWQSGNKLARKYLKQHLLTLMKEISFVIIRVSGVVVR